MAAARVRMERRRKWWNLTEALAPVVTLELVVEMESVTTVAMAMASTVVIIEVVTAVEEISHDGDDHRNQMLTMRLVCWCRRRS